MYWKMLNAGTKVTFREFEFLPHGFLLYLVPFPTKMLFSEVKDIVKHISLSISGKKIKEFKEEKVSKKALKEVEAIIEQEDEEGSD